jgi:hypothetical protein
MLSFKSSKYQNVFQNLRHPFVSVFENNQIRIHIQVKMR